MPSVSEQEAPILVVQVLKINGVSELTATPTKTAKASHSRNYRLYGKTTPEFYKCNTTSKTLNYIIKDQSDTIIYLEARNGTHEHVRIEKTLDSLQSFKLFPASSLFA